MRITEKHYAPWVRERQEQLVFGVLGRRLNRNEGYMEKHARVIPKGMVPAGGIEPTA